MGRLLMRVGTALRSPWCLAAHGKCMIRWLSRLLMTWRVEGWREAWRGGERQLVHMWASARGPVERDELANAVCLFFQKKAGGREVKAKHRRNREQSSSRCVCVCVGVFLFLSFSWPVCAVSVRVGMDVLSRRKKAEEGTECLSPAALTTHPPTPSFRT